MKNPLFELRRRQLREYHKSHPWDRLINGMRIYHVYGGEYTKPLTWWDDVGFVRNKYKVMVWWIHPRMAYRDEVENLANDVCPYPDEGVDFCGEWLSKKNANYVKVGKSRKKVISYSSPGPRPRPSVKEWLDQLQAAEEKILTEGDVVAKPSFKVETLGWCRGVSICAPMEVHSHDDLKTLTEMVKRILNGETTIASEFPGYVYTKENWNAEKIILDPFNKVHSVLC